MKRPQHCKGCALYYNAGHPKESKNERFNSWCLGSSRPASKAIGFCKTHGLKKEQTEFPNRKENYGKLQEKETKKL